MATQMPQVLAAVRFAGGTASAGLLEALENLRELNATGARRVPADAPDGFVPARWRGYLETAAKSGNTSAYRHYWELCTLLALRDGLRSGDVFVPGSRRYSDPAAYLLTPDKWVDQRAEFCQLVGKPADPDRALAAAADERRTRSPQRSRSTGHCGAPSTPPDTSPTRPRGRYSRILPGTCGRWLPSEMPSVGNWLAISSAVRGPGWRYSCVIRRSGTQIAHTPARAASASSATATPLRKWTASVAGGRGRPSRPGRRQQRSGRAGHGCAAARTRVKSRSGWVVLEPSRVRRAESGTRGLPADADRAPIRFPRRARLYV